MCRAKDEVAKIRSPLRDNQRSLWIHWIEVVGGFGQMLVREMRANPAWNMNPVAFLDDDPTKARRWIVGVPVRGALDELERVIHRYSVDEVILSSPAINGKVEQRIRDVCGRLDRPVRRLQMQIS